MVREQAIVSHHYALSSPPTCERVGNRSLVSSAGRALDSYSRHQTHEESRCHFCRRRSYPDWIARRVSPWPTHSLTCWQLVRNRSPRCARSVWSFFVLIIPTGEKCDYNPTVRGSSPLRGLMFWFLLYFWINQIGSIRDCTYCSLNDLYFLWSHPKS